MAQENLIDVANACQADRAESEGTSPGESRSWEPPCWPSDDLASPAPRVANRAIGWRGPLRFHSLPKGLSISRH
ncbi:MAG: hypothetical protein JWO72_685 [Caulobacteraceae bacterium]|jgi:hypothetical protein|nr:hypothetical protein [Caulobacteraceae bacterium]